MHSAWLMPTGFGLRWLHMQASRYPRTVVELLKFNLLSTDMHFGWDENEKEDPRRRWYESLSWNFSILVGRENYFPEGRECSFSDTYLEYYIWEVLARHFL